MMLVVPDEYVNASGVPGSWHEREAGAAYAAMSADALAVEHGDHVGQLRRRRGRSTPRSTAGPAASSAGRSQVMAARGRPARPTAGRRPARRRRSTPSPTATPTARLVMLLAMDQRQQLGRPGVDRLERRVVAHAPAGPARPAGRSARPPAGPGRPPRRVGRARSSGVVSSPLTSSSSRPSSRAASAPSVAGIGRAAHWPVGPRRPHPAGAGAGRGTRRSGDRRCTGADRRHRTAGQAGRQRDRQGEVVRQRPGRPALDAVGRERPAARPVDLDAEARRRARPATGSRSARPVRWPRRASASSTHLVGLARGPPAGRRVGRRCRCGPGRRRARPTGRRGSSGASRAARSW